MQTFKDNAGREWSISLDGPKIREVRKQCSVDLAAIDSYRKLTQDYCLLVDVLWVLCRAQAQTADVNDVQFGEALVGDAFDGASAAMLESMADFFPRQTRELLRAMVAADQQMTQAGISKAVAKIQDPELQAKVLSDLEAKMDTAILDALTQLNSATASPDSAESHPTA